MASSNWSRTGTTKQEWESSDYEPSLPVSEKSNPLTRDIDKASALDIVKMLQSCDAQMFQDETKNAYLRLLSNQVVETLMDVAKRVELILQDPEDKLVVLSGCGTSGRLAFLTAFGFNKALREQNQSCLYSYVIAGGDKALFSSQEAPEDDPSLGVLSLKKVCEGKKEVLFFGISCGLSAPFVAGQLDFCLQHPEVFTPVLVGFNPAHQARDEPIPGHAFTFHSVMQRIQELAKTQKAFLINPAVGPEAISGSSRMKGGSATKILLEVVLCAAHAACFSHEPVTRNGILQHIRSYNRTLEVTYAQTDKIAALVEAGGESLQCSGRVCYLGWGSLAVLGLIDASECIPTFGAGYDDIRGFINGGYTKLENSEGPLTALGPEFGIAHQDFLQHVLPSLSNQDMVVLIYTHSDDVGEVAALAHRVRTKTRNIHAVCHTLEGNTSSSALQDEIGELCASSVVMSWRCEAPNCGFTPHLHWELSTKLVLNALSTGAHILKGKIYQNHMVDLQVTNSKLYRRATRLLQRLSAHPEAHCEKALLQAIYQEHTPTSPNDIISHTSIARSRSKVVPLALLCLLTGCSLVEAESRLLQQPIVREAVEVWM